VYILCSNFVEKCEENVWYKHLVTTKDLLVDAFVVDDDLTIIWAGETKGTTNPGSSRSHFSTYGPVIPSFVLEVQPEYALALEALVDDVGGSVFQIVLLCIVDDQYYRPSHPQFRQPVKYAPLPPFFYKWVRFCFTQDTPPMSAH